MNNRLLLVKIILAIGLNTTTRPPSASKPTNNIGLKVIHVHAQETTSKDRP